MADAEEFAIDHGDDFAADLVGISMRVESGLDVRAFGPIPEALLLFLIGFRLLGGQAGLFKAEAASAEVAPARVTMSAQNSRRRRSSVSGSSSVAAVSSHRA